MTTIFTIGHSTRPIGDFLDLLQEFDIRTLVDIRTIPQSRFNPQYGQQALDASLKERQIDYVYMKALGGRRSPRADSTNTGWRNSGFRGYADYMQTPEFQAALEQLIDLAGGSRCAIMCAEAVPWRCHRSLVGDALLVRGVEVENIMSAGKSSPHKLTPFAIAQGARLSYPKPSDQMALPI